MTDAKKSPVEVLLGPIASSLELIAPERALELAERAAGVRLILTDKPRMGFWARSDERTIAASRRGLEYLWVLSYAGWCLWERRPPAGSATHLAFSAESATAVIPVLVDWACANQKQAEYKPWPADCPQPAPLKDSGVPVSPERVASELAVCAAGWILHHELAHIANKDVNDALMSLAQEKRADSEATAWILEKAPKGVSAVKRGLGMAIATVAIAGFELLVPRRPGGPRSHPSAADRIYRALEHPSLSDGRVQWVAAALLQLLLDRAGVEIAGTEYETTDDWLSAQCLALQRRLES